VLECRIVGMYTINYNINKCARVLYTNIDQSLLISLHGVLNCAIGGLDCHVVTAEYRARVHSIQL